MLDLPDIHRQTDSRNIPVRVGFCGIHAPLVLNLRGNSEAMRRDCVLRCSVLLAADKRGTHLSRIVRAIRYRPMTSGAGIVTNFLKDLCKMLESESAWVSYSFEYPEYCTTHLYGWVAESGDVCVAHRMTVPVMTVCPCSLELNDGKAAHVQRCYVTGSVLQGNSHERIWFEDMHKALSQSGSRPVKDVVRRTDERDMVRAAFDNPKFAEDAVRDALIGLRSIDNVVGVHIKVRSQESIHPFDVSAEAMWGHCPPELYAEV